MIRTSVAAFLCIGLGSACIQPMNSPKEMRLPRPDTLQGGAVPGVSKVRVVGKKVAEKVEPATLYSGDGFHCTVTPGRFAEVKIGENVLCPWTK